MQVVNFIANAARYGVTIKALGPCSWNVAKPNSQQLIKSELLQTDTSTMRRAAAPCHAHRAVHKGGRDIT